MRRCLVHFDETVFWPPSSDEKSNSGKDSLQLRMTEDKLQTTEDKLQTTEDKLQSTADKLQTTEDKLQSTEDKLQSTEDKLQSTEDQLQRLQVELSAVKSQEARQQDEMNRLYATLIDVLLYFNFLLL